jgi:hypothetical protein
MDALAALHTDGPALLARNKAGSPVGFEAGCFNWTAARNAVDSAPDPESTIFLLRPTLVDDAFPRQFGLAHTLVAVGSFAAAEIFAQKTRERWRTSPWLAAQLALAAVLPPLLAMGPTRSGLPTASKTGIALLALASLTAAHFAWFVRPDRPSSYHALAAGILLGALASPLYSLTHVNVPILVASACLLGVACTCCLSKGQGGDCDDEEAATRDLRWARQQGRWGGAAVVFGMAGGVVLAYGTTSAFPFRSYADAATGVAVLEGELPVPAACLAEKAADAVVFCVVSSWDHVVSDRTLAAVATRPARVLSRAATDVALVQSVAAVFGLAAASMFARAVHCEPEMSPDTAAHHRYVGLSVSGWVELGPPLGLAVFWALEAGSDHADQLDVVATAALAVLVAVLWALAELYRAQENPLREEGERLPSPQPYAPHQWQELAALGTFLFGALLLLSAFVMMWGDDGDDGFADLPILEVFVPLIGFMYVVSTWFCPMPRRRAWDREAEWGAARFSKTEWLAAATGVKAVLGWIVVAYALNVDFLK